MYASSNAAMLLIHVTRFNRVTLSCDVLLMASRMCLIPFTEGSEIAALT